MKLRPDYSSQNGRLWDLLAGFVTAILINGLILWLPANTSFLHANSGFASLLPWLVNGLMILVFLLILPWFALGYLLAGAVVLSISLLVMAIPIYGTTLLVIGCFLVMAAFAATAQFMGANGADMGEEAGILGQSGLTMDNLDPTVLAIFGLITFIIVIALVLWSVGAHLTKRNAEVGEDQEGEE